MREGFDKEIDSLLHRAARAPTAARGNGVGASRPETHLDADELAAFAEGALPEVARSNAVSHLADCDECRALAVNLTRAAGIETKLEKHALAAAASPARESVPKRGWLAAIFAPRTLRYVAPALVVCLVAAVSFIALRSRNGSGLVSLRDERTTGTRPSIATTQTDSQPANETAMNSNASSTNANTATTKPDAEGLTLNDKKTTAEAPAAEFRNKDTASDAPDGSAAGAPVESKAAGEVASAQPPPPAKEEDAAGGPPEPVEASKPAKVAEVPAPKSGYNTKAGPSPAPAQTDDELARNEVMQKRNAQQRGLEPQSPDGGSRQRSAANNASNVGGLASTPRDDRDERSRRAENAPAARRGGRSGQDAVDGSNRESTSEESRSVAGHRFRRAGGAWVDVNYKSTMSSTGVRRGTDGYRSLVADIPELGRIAEQLGGEVIVVVRGRAYRIR